jgi:hypothetical protein
MSRKFIYGLVDPRDGQLRYVGQTSMGFVRPKKLHAAKCGSWQKSLKNKGLEPEIIVLEETDDLNCAEEFWISSFRMIGADLTNMTTGGEGLKGATLETRRKMREAKLGRRLTDEHRKKISESCRRIKKSPKTVETRAKISASLRGRKASDETRLKMSITRLGKKRGPYRRTANV